MNPFLGKLIYLLIGSPFTYMFTFFTVSTLVVKSYIIVLLAGKLRSTEQVWIPTYFGVDLLLILGVLGICFGVWKLPIKEFKKKVILFIILLFACAATVGTFTVSLSVYKEIGFFMRWSVMLCSMSGADVVKAAAIDKMLPLYITLACEGFGFLVGLIVSLKNFSWKAPFINTLIESEPTIDEVEPIETLIIQNEEDNKSQTPEKEKVKPVSKLFTSVVICLLGILLLYFIGGTIVRRKNLKTTDDLVFNPFILSVLGSFETLRTFCKPQGFIDADDKVKEWLKQCKTINQVTEQLVSKKQTCFNSTEYVTDYSFIKRTKDSPIKNIVIIFMESTRKEGGPFLYNSTFGKRINEKMRKEKQITTFLDQLVNKSMYTPNARTVVSYTLKSYIGGMCSMYPYPSNFNLDYKHNLYLDCLPKLLRKYGNFSSIYITPMLSTLDHTDDLCLKMGVDEAWGVKEVEAGKFGLPPKEKANGLGYEDNFFRKPMMEWVDLQVKQNKSFMIMYSSSVTHAEFGIPHPWEWEHYVDDDRSNAYINTLKYMDNWYKNVYGDFEKRGLDKNTLFIMFGDHGVSLGEHGMWITTDIPYETQFNIPMIIYSGNPQWQAAFPPRKSNEVWSTLDVLPTVLDALKFDGKNTKFTGNYLHEGKSILRGDMKKKIEISLTNPGMTTMVFRENEKSAILGGLTERRPELYDLSKDPEQEEELDIDEMPEDWKKWYDDIKRVRGAFIAKQLEWYGEY